MAQGTSAKAVALIICTVLVVFGFGAFNLFAVSEPKAATVNGVDITVRQFNAAVDRRKDTIRAQLGEDVDPAFVDSVVNEPLILRQLVNRSLYEQAADDLGLVGSKAEFERSIRSNPAFQENGEFSTERLQQTLAASGYSLRSYEGAVSSDAKVTQLLNLQENSNFYTPADLREFVAAQRQARDVAYLEFKSSEYGQDIEVTDDEMREHFDANRSDYMSEELFSFEYVELQQSKFVEESSLTEEEVLSLYEAEVASVRSNAERRGRHILRNVDEDRTVEEAMAEIRDARERIANGEKFEEVAKEISDDVGSALEGGDLGFAARGVFVKPFEDSLWSLEVGEISQPVESQFGIHLIELLEVQEIEVPLFADRREELVKIQAEEAAKRAFDEAVERADELAFEDYSSLEPVATAFDLVIENTGDISRSNADGIFAEARVRSDLFTTDVLDNGFNSKPIYIGQDRAIIGRLVTRTDSALLLFDDVKEQIKATLLSEKSRDAVLAAVENAQEDLLEDFDFSAVAESYSLEWQRLENVTRDDTELPREVRDVVFESSLPRLDEHKILRSSGLGSEYVLVVSRVERGDVAALTEEERTSAEEFLDSQLRERSIIAFINYLHDEASIEYIVPNEE